MPVEPESPDAVLYPLSHTGGTETPNRSVNVLFCCRGAPLRCLCGLVCSDELCFPSPPSAGLIERRCDTFPECCDVLHSPPGQQGGQGALLYDYLCCHVDEGRIGSGLIRVLHHGDVWSGELGSSSGTCASVCVCVYTSVAVWLNVFPPLNAVAALLFLCAGSTSQSRWLALEPKFHS